MSISTINYNHRLEKTDEFALDLLNNGINNHQSTNIILICEELFPEITYRTQNSINVFYHRFDLSTHGSVNSATKRQTNIADLYHEPVGFVIEKHPSTILNIMKYLTLGKVIPKVVMQILVRIGSLSDADESKKSLEVQYSYEFQNVSIVYCRENNRTGLIYFTFEYKKCTITANQFDVEGNQLGKIITEIDITGNGPSFDQAIESAAL